MNRILGLTMVDICSILLWNLFKNCTQVSRRTLSMLCEMKNRSVQSSCFASELCSLQSLAGVEILAARIFEQEARQ